MICTMYSPGSISEPNKSADAAIIWRGSFSPSAGTEPGDRKSTRLNSSHLVISYAVFCLKKKKQQISQCNNKKRNNISNSGKYRYDKQLSKLSRNMRCFVESMSTHVILEHT